MPSSFAQAINDPESEIAPIMAPRMAMTSGTVWCSTFVRNSSTAAMAAAAPPPMPL